MEFKSFALPPLKRMMLKRQQEEAEENKQNSQNDGRSWLHLPAKKRRGSHRDSFAALAAAPPTYLLPAKKRVFAIPCLSPVRIIHHPFDLNQQYRPSPQKIKNGGYGTRSTDVESEGVEEKGSPSFHGMGQWTESANIEKGVVEDDGAREEHDERENGKEAEAQKIEEAEDDNGIEKKYQEECTSVEKKNEIEQSIQQERGDVDDTTAEEAKDEIDDVTECAICGGTDGSESDPIVFCDGCDLMVHATCFGNPLIQGIPEGDWFCPKCAVSRSEKTLEDISCVLCPVKSGAMKNTNDGRWAHIVCALLVPETFFEDPSGREGIDCSRVPSWRWDNVCYLCQGSSGCAIDCSVPGCELAFHVTCALKEDLCIEYKTVKRKKSAIIAGFCKAHSDLWKKEQRTGKFKIVAGHQNM